MPHLTARLSLLAVILLTTAAVAQQDRTRDYEAERRQLENMRNEIRNIERDITNIDNQIEDRQKQLADAPKTIDPAEKALKEAEKRAEKAKGAMPDMKKKLDGADAKLGTVLKSLKTGYDGAAQLDAADAKIAEKRKALEEARAAAVVKLKDNAGYKVAKQRVDLAKSRADFLLAEREEGRGSSTDVAEAASDLLRYQAELDAQEAKVLMADERYKKAKADFDEADKTLAYLRSQMTEKLKGHPDYAAAETALAGAREIYAAAAKEMAEASKARAEASGTLNKLKAQVKEFQSQTEQLKNRKVSLQNQLRAKERRMQDFARQIGR